MADAVVGIVANPLSGRDIRRLVAKASVFPTAEKASMVQRMLTAFGSTGVERALLNTDLGGISAAVLRGLRTRRAGDPPWPDVAFLESGPITQSAADTTTAVREMKAAGARVIVCLGGDGTARVAAAACGDTPLLALSTGTNNAFPRMREATVAGLAAGLIAAGKVEPVPPHVRRSPVLEVTAAGRTEIALVDVAVTAAGHVGSRAVWNPATLTELYCTFAEPDGIGLSSVPGLLCPSPREEPDGVALRLGPPGDCPTVVRAPIAPGLVADVGVREWHRLRPGEEHRVAADHGVIAVDGEREIEFHGAPGPGGERGPREEHDPSGKPGESKRPGTPGKLGEPAEHGVPGADGEGRPSGEREAPREAGERGALPPAPAVRLRVDGPWCVDVRAVLATAAGCGLFSYDGRYA